MTLVPSHLSRLVAGLLPLAVLAGCASSGLEQAAKAQLGKAQTAYRQGTPPGGGPARLRIAWPRASRQGPAREGTDRLSPGAVRPERAGACPAAARRRTEGRPGGRAGCESGDQTAVR